MVGEVEDAAMLRAIARAGSALGSSNPNPAVGAVVLTADGTVAGEAATAPAGGPHAEVTALQQAGSRARGGTLVVTLEPCNHVGRTPPCTEAILDAGIARVVYAVTDPHPPASGGAERLRSRGLDVESGVREETARRDLEPWLTAVGRGRPHLTWKYAATLDGHAAAADGSSRWITGEAARVDVHRERARADAVVAGVGTVLADDARLTVRDWDAVRQPLRVVVDSRARTPLSARVLDGAAPTLVATSDAADPDRVERLRAVGAEVLVLPRCGDRVDLTALLAALFEREVFLLLLEGGPTLAASFVRQRMVDRIIGYHAPALLGSGPAPLADIGVSTVRDVERLRLVDVTSLGNDVRIVAAVDGGG